MKLILTATGIAGIAASIILTGSLSSAQVKAADLSNGQSKFQINCMVCHGSKGLGDGPAAAGMNKKPANISKKLNSIFQSDAKLTQDVMKGKTGMPGFQGVLSEADVADIFAYIRSINA